MRSVYTFFLLLVAGIALIIVSCIKKYTTSQHGEMKSHLTAGLCVSCHAPNATAQPVFTAGGTVWDEMRVKSQPRAVVRLYTRPKAQGKLVATIRTDSLGNFYTTQNIDYSKGLYPTLYGTPGVKDDIKHMSRPVFMGDCNRCHGLSEESLGID